MLLSIIIPVYNIEKYIGRCLDSCLSQKFDKTNYEIICVNDGSTDDSLVVLNEYKEKYLDFNITVIDKPNGGVSSARNVGINVANGDYIWFVDGDDWINTNSLNVIQNALTDAGGQPDVILFGFSFEYEHKVKEAKCDKFYFSEGCGLLNGSYSNSICCRWFKCKLLKNNGLFFDETMKYAEDTLFLANVKRISKTALCMESDIYVYYQRSNSAMKKIDAEKHCLCMLKLANYYKQHISEGTFKNAMVRAMQAACQDVCLYCSNVRFAIDFVKLLKSQGLYPFGIDWKQLKRDKRQRIKNDLLNWLFAFLSFEPYFWVCWAFCGLAFKHHRGKKFNIKTFKNWFGEE